MDLDEARKKKMNKRRDELLNRMKNAVKRNNRKKKIEKLEDNPDLWKGLQ